MRQKLEKLTRAAANMSPMVANQVGGVVHPLMGLLAELVEEVEQLKKNTASPGKGGG